MPDTRRDTNLQTDEHASRRAARAAAYDIAIGPVKDALERAGIDPTDVGRFVNRPHPGLIEPERFDQERAAPILLELLPDVAHPARETVVRRLKAKSVKPQATAVLIEEFRTQNDPHYKWVVADTLQTVAGHSQLDEIIDLAADKRHGMSRAPLLDIVRRSKTEHAIRVLIDALDDPTVTLAAMSALRRAIGSAAAKPHIAALIDDPNDVVRRSARSQLKRIDKSLAR